MLAGTVAKGISDPKLGDSGTTHRSPALSIVSIIVIVDTIDPDQPITPIIPAARAGAVGPLSAEESQRIFRQARRRPESR